MADGIAACMAIGMTDGTGIVTGGVIATKEAIAGTAGIGGVGGTVIVTKRLRLKEVAL